MKAKDWEDMNLVVIELREKRRDIEPEAKLGWYVRFWHKFNKPELTADDQKLDLQETKQNEQ